MVFAHSVMDASVSRRVGLGCRAGPPRFTPPSHMPIQFFDTLSQRLVPFEPREPGHARVYVCGPTVYDHAHLGHARAAVVYDVLTRHLRERGLRVTYVRNITDVDDKIIKRAAELGEEPAVLAKRFVDAYVEDTARLFCEPPEVEPRVSDHVPQIVALIEKLIALGSAYAVDGDVFYSVASFPEYGKLSHRKLDELELGGSGRVSDDELSRKRHPADFALWKSAKPGEPTWASPWGPGRPGWHIECSAMCLEHLGDTCDVHGGGLDLVFPHHENEIAQSEAATKKPFSQLWVHNGFIQVDKEKMSKSLGNFFTARESFRFVEPEAVRYWLLSAHYRAPVNLEIDQDDAGKLRGFPQLEEAERRVEYLYATRERLAALPAERFDDAGTKVDPEFGKIPGQILRALDDDLGFPEALAALAEFLKRVNEAIDGASRKSGKLTRATQREIDQGYALIGRVLGLGLGDGPALLERIRMRRLAAAGLDKAHVEKQIAERIAARGQKDFARADQIRDALAAAGVELMDGARGTDWRMK
jgi:cysteinyl-tRNA synthetase